MIKFVDEVMDKDYDVIIFTSKSLEFKKILGYSDQFFADIIRL